jgi:uncharacterized protein
MGWVQYQTLRMTKWFRRWHRRQHKIKVSLRGGVLHRLFGERIFHRHIWAVNLQSVAGGVSLGLFAACTPTIPFHMLLTVLGAIVLGVNLPIALAACWLANPLTVVPIYMAEAKLGRHLLGDTRLAETVLKWFRFDGRTGQFMEEGLYLWAGALIFALGAALAGNLLVRASWGVARYLKSTPARPGTPQN